MTSKKKQKVSEPKPVVDTPDTNVEYPAEFITAYMKLREREGGFQNDPKDRGNWTSGKIGVGELKGTNTGISAMSYPHLDISSLKEDHKMDIYYRDYWLEAKSDKYDSAIGFQVFDASVHHGIANSSRMLQRAIGAVDDGDIGPITLTKLAALPIYVVLMNFAAERLLFMAKISSYQRYGRGWSRRVAHNLQDAAKSLAKRGF